MNYLYLSDFDRPGMPKSSDKDAQKKKNEAALVAARNAKNTTVVRWYLMIYPYGRKGLVSRLEREIERRKKAGEEPIDYFAPVYVEAKTIDGQVVRTEKQLFENYVFIRSSVKEIFRMKQQEEPYNFPRREVSSKGEYHYPYVSDETIQYLKWIARSYSGIIPVYTDDKSWLVKGDRIRITSGPFKNIEARLFDNQKNHRKTVMLLVDNWMSVPLLHVRESQYKLIALNNRTVEKGDFKIGDEVLPALHEILCRRFKGEVGETDRNFVQGIIDRYTGRVFSSDIMRCKYYAVLLMAHSILGNIDKQEHLTAIIHEMLPSITAEQSKALLLAALYACTDNSLYYLQVHRITEPWTKEQSPKKSKQQLLSRLADYDRYLGH